MTRGQADYFLRVVARDVADYDNIPRNCLARLPGVSSMQTIFVLRPIREWQGYPIRAIRSGPECVRIPGAGGRSNNRARMLGWTNPSGASARPGTETGRR